MRKFRGNTIAEYGLIGVIILVACMILVLLVGQNLDSLLKGLKGDMKGSIASAEGFQKKAKSEQYYKNVGSNFTGATLSVCTGKICVEIPYSKENKHVVQTSGGMGNEYTTGQFVKLLHKVVPTLKPEEVENLLGKLLTDLSNTTYQVSDSQYTLAQICQSTSQCDYNFNIPNDVYDKLSKKEKWKIHEKIKEINELKAMIDQLSAAGLNNHQQNVVENTVAETKTTAATMNSGNITTAAVVTNNDGKQQANVANAVGGSANTAGITPAAGPTATAASAAAAGGVTGPAPTVTAPTGIVMSQAQNQQAAATNAATTGDPTSVAAVNSTATQTAASNNAPAANAGVTTAPAATGTPTPTTTTTAGNTAGAGTTTSTAAPATTTTTTTTPAPTTTTTTASPDPTMTGAGVGAAAGAVTGALIGAAVGGPVGAVVGAGVGAVLGAGGGAAIGAAAGPALGGGGGGSNPTGCATGDCTGGTSTGGFNDIGGGG